GSETLMLGRVLWSEFFSNRDWPLASAVAVLILAIVIGPVILFRDSLRAGEGEDAGA
ncbi:MAG: putrescine ABC transporter permease PotH, partial [Hyphomicrobiales bacterium]